MSGRGRLSWMMIAVLAVCGVAVAQRAEIFVPTPRGTGETLDPSGSTAASEAPAVVKTLQGDVLNGRIVSIDSEGVMRLLGAAFTGEVKVATGAVDRVTMRSSKNERGQDTVQMTNGDRIRGELVSVTPEAVVINTDVAGTLKIRCGLVNAIFLGRGSDMLVESNFTAGTMDPWAIKSGTWNVSDSQLNCTSNGNNAMVAAEVDQKEAVTFVAKVKCPSGNTNIWMTLFADEPTGQYGRNSLYVGWQSSELYMGYCQNGSTNNYTSRSMGRNVREGTLRVSYDPKAGKVHVWMDGTDYGEYTPPVKPAAGKWVMLTSYYTSNFSELSVLRGVVPPENTATAGGEDETNVIEFSNGDRVSAKEISMTGGKFKVKTSFGDLTPEAGKVVSVVFSKKDREEPRRMKEDVEVQTAGGRMTVGMKELTGTHLVGTSSCYGDVKLSREAIRGLRFNIYR